MTGFWRVSLLLLVFGSVAPLQAQEARLRGTVIEAFTGRPLAGATVSAAGVSARSNADGTFELRLPAGNHTLETRASDHLDDKQPLLIAAGAERSVDIYLIDRGRLREQVTVEARASDAEGAPAVLPVRPADVMAVAGAADNIFRTLQTLPGVAATDEFGSRLSVRGGGPDQNLTLMDGVEIHNPYRLFGLTSAFNPETVKSFELSAGAFSAKYGDRLSSLLTVENRDGAGGKRFGGSSALSITDANLIFEGALPGAKKGSWLVTARRTYYDFVADSFVGGSLPEFGDVQLKASLETRPGQRLSLFALRSREKTDASFDDTHSTDQGVFKTAAKNDLVSARFDSTFGARVSASTVLAYYLNSDALDVTAQFQNNERRSNARSDTVGYRQANVVFTRDLSVRDLSLRQELLYEASGRHLIESGFELHGLQTGVSWQITGDRNPNEANGSSVRGGSGLPSLLDSEVDSGRGGAWLLDRYQMLRRVVVEPGLRIGWSGVNRKRVIEPRLAATLFLGARNKLRFGTGLHAQSPGYEKLIQSDYFVDLSDASGLGLAHERAVHAVLGFERDLGSGITARVESYYKGFDDLIVGRLETEAERQARVAQYDFPAALQSSVPTAAQITTEPVNGSGGRAYGFDLYLARRAVAPETRLTGWASYTFGRADRDSYGRTLPFEYDRRHAFSLVAGYRASRKLDLALTARVSSGFPYTPVLGLRVNAMPDSTDRDHDGNTSELVPERDLLGLLVYVADRGDVSQLLGGRLPLFARVDLRAGFRPKGPQGRWLFYLDVINLLNRKNVGAYETTLVYNPVADKPRIAEKPSQSIPFLPSFGIRFRF